MCDAFNNIIFVPVPSIRGTPVYTFRRNIFHIYCCVNAGARIQRHTARKSTPCCIIYISCSPLSCPSLWRPPCFFLAGWARPEIPFPLVDVRVDVYRQDHSSRNGYRSSFLTRPKSPHEDFGVQSPDTSKQAGRYTH